MNNNQIKKFDSIIKNATANFELPFNENAWLLMDEKLNNELVSGKKKRTFFWWLIPAIIVVAAVGAFTYNKNAAKIASPAIIASTINTTKTPTNVENIEQKNNVENNKTIKTTITKSDIPTTPKAFVIAAIKPKVASNKNLFTPAIETTNKSKLKKEKEFPTTKNIATEINIPKNASVSYAKNDNDIVTTTAPKTIAAISTIETSNAAIKSVTNNYAASQIHNKFVVNYKILEAIANKNEIPNLSVYETWKPALLKVYPPILLPNKWYITANIANNISYASNPRISDSKLAFNFNIGFNVDNQISFQTGVGFGNRTYSFLPNEFVFSGNPILLKYIRNIDANFNIVEVPITFKYQFSEKPNTGLFFTTGFSTLFFKKENYTLTIDKGNGGPVELLDWNFNNVTSNLSMFNFSIGYQFPMTKSLILTVEPYIQLPTRNIGEGNNRMSSTGLQIGAKYNFIKHK